MSAAAVPVPALAARIMAHLVAGYPTWEASLEFGQGLIDGGAGFLEVQFPFSDPTADGPRIQEACDVALAAGFHLEAGFELLAQLRAHTDRPIAVMSYANPIVHLGVEQFVARCATAGANGIVAPDLPFDYDEGLYRAGASAGVEVIPVVVPTMSRPRLEALMQQPATDLVYVALRAGTTGSYTEIGAANIAFLESVRALGGRPVAGFGVREQRQVEALAPHVEYVVVGSMLVQALQEQPDRPPHDVARAALAALTG